MGRRLCDLNTGEIYEEVVKVITKKQQETATEYKKRKEQRQKLFDKISRHCGNFYFYRYDKLLHQLNQDTAIGFRFLYLCACADKDGYFIKYNGEYCRTKEDFVYIFEKTKPTVRKYVDELIGDNLLFKDDKGYRINPLFYSAGNITDEFKRNSIRTFNNAIKELYYNSDPREHSLIGQFLKLAPYINIYTNTLCWNIEEKNKDYIEPLSRNEIIGILEIESKYSYTIFNKLERIFIKGEPVLGKFTSSGQDLYRINPRLFYRGNNVKELQDLIDMFDINKKQYIKYVEKKKMKKRS